jgi:hypothetical protein
MNALNALKIRSHQRILARLLVALLFLAIGFSSAGSKIEPGLALPLHPSDLPEGYHDGGEGATNRGAATPRGGRWTPTIALGICKFAFSRTAAQWLP